jgi:hypothetical protein
MSGGTEWEDEGECEWRERERAVSVGFLERVAEFTGMENRAEGDETAS